MAEGQVEVGKILGKVGYGLGRSFEGQSLCRGRCRVRGEGISD